jgi:hypothetical protein
MTMTALLGILFIADAQPVTAGRGVHGTVPTHTIAASTRCSNAKPHHGRFGCVLYSEPSGRAGATSTGPPSSATVGILGWIRGAESFQTLS